MPGTTRGPRKSPAHKMIPGNLTASAYRRSQTKRFSPTSVVKRGARPPPKNSDSSPDGACGSSGGIETWAAPGAGVGELCAPGEALAAGAGVGGVFAVNF